MMEFWNTLREIFNVVGFGIAFFLGKALVEHALATLGILGMGYVEDGEE